MELSERIKYQLGQLMVANTALAAELDEVKEKLAKYEKADKDRAEIPPEEK